jgi:hypothetical protein
MSILVHDDKQKKCISTLLTINHQISLQSSWLFLTSKKLFSMKSGQLFQLFKMATPRLANSTMSGHKYNVMTNARLGLQHYLMNKNVGRLLKH